MEFKVSDETLAEEELSRIKTILTYKYGSPTESKRGSIADWDLPAMVASWRDLPIGFSRIELFFRHWFPPAAREKLAEKRSGWSETELDELGVAQEIVVMYYGEKEQECMAAISSKNF